MKFVRLDRSTVLNLDSVASVTWGGDGQQLVATVRYLVASATALSDHGQLAYERFTGNAAQALMQILDRDIGGVGVQDADRSTSVLVPATSPAKAPSPSESLEMLVSGRARKKAWYYVKVSDRGYFLAMVNMKGSCSMRTFDAETGKFLGKRYAHGDFQEQFTGFLQGAEEVTVDRQPNLDLECRDQLPETVLSYLKAQVPVEP